MKKKDTVSKARCIICDSTDKWENIDQFRIKPHDMNMCTNCGFVTYPNRIKDEKDLKDYYEKDYRQPPTVNNLWTGQRKLHYHASFLTPVINEFREGRKGNVDIFEEGAANGMFLHWMKKNIGKGCNVFGSEWTQSFRRNAYWDYDVRLDTKFDKSRKYDLITSYKVAEHQINVDKKLMEYADQLKEGGYLYISVPLWFDRLSNFGLTGFDLEYYYHPDHINVWNKKLFESLLRKCGFEIVDQNHVIYDSTYLCIKSKDGPMELEKEADDFCNPVQAKEIMGFIFKANEHMTKLEYKEALEVYANFPTAWIAHYELNKKEFHPRGYKFIQKEIIEKALECCPGSVDIIEMAADIALRYEQHDDALAFLQKSYDMKPGGARALMQLGKCLRSMTLIEKDPVNREKLFHESRKTMQELEKVSMQTQADAITWRYYDQAQLPIPSAP